MTTGQGGAMAETLMLPGSAEEVAAIQSVGKRRALERAQQSPFWQRRLADVVIDMSRLDEPDEWARIPILTKEELRTLPVDAFYSDFCIADRKRTSEYWRSGGSTGKPLLYPRTRTDLSYAMAGFRRVYACAGVGSGDMVHISLPLGIHPAGHMCARAAECEGAAVMWAGAGNAAPSLMQLDLIRTFRPSVWVGMSSYAIHLANLAAAEGFRLADCGIHTVICTAEPLSGAKRAKLSDLWGAKVYDSIGMTEMMMMGAETAPDSGFRIWSDFVFPEVVDPATHRPVAPGEEGLLVVTSLSTNEATPFLRWNTGDVVRLTPAEEAGPLSDGEGGIDGRFAHFPVMRHAHRTAGFFKVRGVNIGHTDFEDMMFSERGIADFRVEVIAEEGRDVLRIHLEASNGTDPAELADTLSARVRRVFEVSPELVWCEHGSIAKAFESSVKATRFVDLRS